MRKTLEVGDLGDRLGLTLLSLQEQPLFVLIFLDDFEGSLTDGGDECHQNIMEMFCEWRQFSHVWGYAF